MKIPVQLKSRKLWLAIIAAVVAFGNGMFEWGLNTEQVITVIAPLLAYVGVEGWGDAQGRGSN